MCTPPPGQLVPVAAPACSSEIIRNSRCVPFAPVSVIGSAPWLTWTVGSMICASCFGFSGSDVSRISVCDSAAE
jgi:hypothetical protein